MQRSEVVFILIPAQDRLLRVACLSKHDFRLVVDECVQLGIEAFDAIEVSTSYLHWRDLFAPDLRRDFPRGKKSVRVHVV